MTARTTRAGSAGRPRARVAIVLKGYPRLSETFIADEIARLEAAGLAIVIVSLRRPTDGAVHPVHEAIAAPVLYLPEYLSDEPDRLAAGRARARELPGYQAARALYEADVVRDPTASRHRRWGQAEVLAAELGDDVALLYVHYLHTPASVARYAAAMRGLPYGFSAHAKDIYTTPAWELAEKIAGAEFGLTCTAHNRTVLGALAHREDKVALAYHGVDVGEFAALERRPATQDGSVTLLSVCRAVEKKGLSDVLAAIAMLPVGVNVRFEHVGGGETDRLEEEAQRLGLADRVAFLGPMDRDGVKAAYARADLFVLASKIAKGGDRDGLPNVIMEAMAAGLPVVSTTVSAVPEIVTEETGILVPPSDPKALAEALLALVGDPARRARLGAAGRRRVEDHFAKEPGIEKVLARLTPYLSAASEAA